MVLHFGLVAGLAYHEMGPLAPGLICDLFVMRQHYDDQQHGIKRQKKGGDDGGEARHKDQFETGGRGPI